MVVVATGWHPWYELKADPENSENLIICAQRWDGLRNRSTGVVYASSNAGKSWRVTLEDASTEWVSEQSCTYGTKHRAYFVSEGSKVVDGVPHHEQGTTRLFTSNDGGQTWLEASKTGWADYSTSAASPSRSSVFTFFNYEGTYDKSQGRGSSVAVLEFSADGKTVDGPFIDPVMVKADYQGIYPSGAVALRDGSSAALYYAATNSPGGERVFHLGLVRVRVGTHPSVASAVLASTRTQCLRFDGNSLAYEPQSDMLAVVYSDQIGDLCGFVVATSHDGGSNWTKHTITNGPKRQDHGIDHVSLALMPDGLMGLVWKDSEFWWFSTVHDQSIASVPLKLTGRQERRKISSDSLMTVIPAPGDRRSDRDPSDVIDLNVLTMTDTIWRSRSLLASGDVFQAVVPVVNSEGQGSLLFTAIPRDGYRDDSASNGTPRLPGQDVTGQSALVYGGFQSFDNVTGTLSVDLRLANRGSRPIRTPIFLVLQRISSRAGSVSVLNGQKSTTGPGAIWDISQSVTGTQIPPGATTYNTFRLSFHLDLSHNETLGTDLLDLGVKVLAAADPALDTLEQGK